MMNFEAARKNMADSQIQTAGIVYPGVLEAFRNVPRETFVPISLQNVAYADEDLHLGEGRYLSEPITHARMVQTVEPKKTDNILDIGGNSGYSAAIMSSLAQNVIALEEDAKTLDYAGQVWEQLKMGNITPVAGPLAEGCAEKGPYDIIFLNGAVAEIPEILLGQLAQGGRLIAIVKKPGAVMGQVTLVRNSVGDKFSSRVLFESGGQYLPGFEPQPAFVFNK